MDLRSAFSMHTTPLTREIRTEDQLLSPMHEQALDGLLRALDRRMSAALIAPAGTGKTALLRRLDEQLPEARYRVRYVKVTGLSKRDMCREIAVACFPWRTAILVARSLVVRRHHRCLCFAMAGFILVACGSSVDDTPTCAEVCQHGRELNCERCLRDDCVSECEKSMSPYVRKQGFQTEDCRVSFGTDTAAQCDSP